MVITYSVPELMSIGEAILDMYPPEWLAQQQQLSALILDQQHQQQQQQQPCNYPVTIGTTGPNVNTHSIINTTIDEQQQFLNNFVMLNQLNNLNYQQYQQQQQHQSHSRTMTADTFLRDFVLLQQKLGLAKSQEPYVTIMDSQAGKDFMSQFQQPDSSGTEAQLTEPVADFFRKAQQIFRPNHYDYPTRVRRLSDVEAELTGQKNPTSST